ncbi:hypothetical protein CYLTODRAFT_386258 [Cylindrobasidium torrendii FP15055 ss-10]|uniref:COP9 signalosome complex subunit 3 n=1 Tax=Cylindrobasidium torrendii FP15055 ss-10 TaxID=1314674 RepID=A0A0D7BTE7_9AGAR|nr:hypothetical protein CYLTODRAFT_386258 [Cylindrobasidium torrendii FP15055 ss-10]
MAPEASIDNIFHHITTSNSPGALNHTIRSTLPKEGRDLILASPLASGQDPLSVLDPHTNSLGYLYILSARLHIQNAMPSWSAIDEFCNVCNIEQLRFAPERVILLVKSIVKLANASDPRLAIPTLRTLATRYPKDPSHLTTIHTQLLIICAQTQSFSLITDFLEANPITNIAKELTPDLHYTDNLIYHYLAGVSLAAVNKWALAEDYFEVCITAPAAAQTISGIQLEALKKLKLVQLISSGNASPLPKYTNGNLLKMFRNTAYHAFVEAYPSKPDVLKRIMDKEKNHFTTEKNMGLLNMALLRAPRWQVKKLTQTYVTLSFGDIGRQVGITSEEEVRDLLLSMIEAGDIHGTLSTTTVTFSDPPVHFSKEQIDKVLRAAQHEAMRLQDLEWEMGRSKEFLQKASKNQQSEWGSQGMSMDEDLFPLMADRGGWSQDIEIA